jgi:hypothetical protein
MSNRDPYSDCRTIPIKNFFVFDKWRTQREVSVFLTALTTARCLLARRMALLLWSLHLNGAARTSKEKVPQTTVCTHYENNCTQHENRLRGPPIAHPYSLHSLLLFRLTGLGRR